MDLEILDAFLLKMMSNDLEMYLCVIIGFWEKFVASLKCAGMRNVTVLA